MKIIDYGFKSGNGLELDENNFEELNIGLVLDIVDNKEKILKRMKTPSFQIDDENLRYIERVSVHKRGVVFDLKVLSDNDRDPDEYGRIYFMHNGEVSFVLKELHSVNWGSQQRNDNAIEVLDERIGLPYKLIKEKKSIPDLLNKSKLRNRLVMESCKKKMIESLGFCDKEIFIIDKDPNKNKGLKLDMNYDC